MARFIADQGTFYRVPVAFTCAVLQVSVSWLYKWLDRAPTPRQSCRAVLDVAVAAEFKAHRRSHGSPRLVADLREGGWTVSEKTVADSMRRRGLIARKTKRRSGTTRADRSAPKFADLVERDFTAVAPNVRWCNDITEIPTGSGKLYLATVIDLYSRRLLAAAASRHPDADLACSAIQMAATVRGGRSVIRQSMGRVGSCFDNAAAEAFFSTLEWEVLSRNAFTDPDHARAVVLEWCNDFYKTTRRHSSANVMSPINYETAALHGEAA